MNAAIHDARYVGASCQGRKWHCDRTGKPAKRPYSAVRIVSINIEYLYSRVLRDKRFGANTNEHITSTVHIQGKERVQWLSLLPSSP